MAFANRLAIISGGVGGLGLAIGRLLHSQGAKLALLYAPAEESKVASLMQETYGSTSSDNVRAYSCDITSPKNVLSVFEALENDATAFPSMLINTAGYVNLQPLEDVTADDIMRHYNINLLGPTLTSQSFARLYFARQQKGSPGGRIVNIASQAAHVALMHHGAYCASKAGLVGLTRSMACEWGAKGITANTVSPGPVWTALGKKPWADREQRETYQAAVPTGKFAEPGEVAQSVVFLCQDTSLNINGTDLRIDGGYTAK